MHMIKPKRQQNIDSYHQSKLGLSKDVSGQNIDSLFLWIDIYTNGSYHGAGLYVKLEVTITSNNRGQSKDSIEHYVPIILLLQMSWYDNWGYKMYHSGTV